MAILAVGPAVALGGWIAFCRHAGMLDIYAGASRMPFHPEYLGRVVAAFVHEASYEVAYAPWILLFLLIVTGRFSRATAMWLSVAAAFLVFLIFTYLHTGSDPTEWIGWSGERVLMTPLVCLFAAAAAGMRGLKTEN